MFFVYKIFLGFLGFLISTAVVVGAPCTLDPSSVSVQWTGFKTGKKIGVSGVFTKIKVQGGKAASVEKALQSTTLLIDTQALDSGDKARDVKIAKIFFAGMQGGNAISAKVTKVDQGYVHAAIKMNGVTRDVPLKLEQKGKKIIASGFIDVLDFSGAKALKAINQACFAKHEGKTWNTVDVVFSAQCQ